MTKKNFILKTITAISCIAFGQVFSRTVTEIDFGEKAVASSFYKLVIPPVYDLDSNIEITQTVNEKGAVVIKGNFIKPITTDDVKIIIKYKDNLGNWVSVWCKTFTAGTEYNQYLDAKFELPASTVSLRNLKIELNSNGNLTNWQSISWNKSVSHYKQSDYTTNNCALDENEYTILFTPKKSETVSLNPNGTVSSIKDRVTSQHLAKKLDNIALSILGNGTIDNTNVNGPAVKIENPNNLTTIASSQKYIYQGSDTSPWEYSYHDPVYMFAGKFSNAGFFINFSNWFMTEEWGGEQAGRGYLDFNNPNALVNRYFNLYNYITEKLTDVIADQEPVVIVISEVTGLRVYKENGQYISLNAISNYNTTNDYGYPPLYEKDRGPGSENFSLSNTSKATLYGIGAIRNKKVTASWNGTSRPLSEIEAEIKKFIKYVGVFGSSTAYDYTDCSSNCLMINTGAQPDNAIQDWTKAPNTYIFDIEKDKSKKGLLIPVKKAYAMWKDNSNADFSFNNPINSTDVKAYLYWEDKAGLVMSGTGYELAIRGTGENAEIEVPIDITKGKGNAVVSLNAFNPTANDYEVKWSWHVWVTDDPTANGSTFRQGFETRVDNTPIPNEEWKWMNRNLGATNTEFLGNDSNKSVGLMYQWGRKDPIPPLAHKDGSTYFINGKAGKYNAADFGELSYQATPKTGWILRNNIIGHENIVNNLKYSVNNPLKIITYAGWNGYDNTDYGTWFSDVQYKFLGTSEHDRVSWDLWSDNRKGLYSNGRKAYDRGASATQEDRLIEADSKSYELKSPYDPCPNGWRIPSHYAGSLGSNFGNNMSPWGRLNSGADDDLSDNSKFKYTTVNPVLSNVKVYPQIGFDFTNQKNQSDPNYNRNIGYFPITGAYVFLGPNEKVDYVSSFNRMGYINWRSTGNLPTATYSPWNGIRGVGIVSDFLNDYTGKMLFAVNQTSMTKGASTCRCIADPNKQIIDANQGFATRYLEGNNVVADAATLKEWAKEPNSFIAYTNTTNPDDRIVKIKLKKAIAMDILYLNGGSNRTFRERTKNTPSIVWTTDRNLISKMEIYPNPNNIDENSELWITLKPNAMGNAVVAFHRGNSGQWLNSKMQDPVVWSWHIWAPRSTVNDLPKYVTEENSNVAADNGMIIPNTSGHIVNPTKSGVAPMETVFMDRDLGALENLPVDINTPDRTESNIKTHFASGLHYQWGRKDPLPTFYFNGGTLYRCSTCTAAPNVIYNDPSYQVFRQIAATNIDGTINLTSYSAGISDANFRDKTASGYSREYNTYKQEAGVSPTDTPSEKTRKILKYSIENPFYFLFHNTSLDNNPSLTTPTEVGFEEIVYNSADARFAKQNRNVANAQVKDWISDEKEMMPERWGHNTEKSPFDPCPNGYRIPDTTMAGLFGFNQGSSPWFYNKGLANVNGPNNTPPNLTTYGIGQGVIAQLKGASNNSVGEIKYPGYMLANSASVAYYGYDPSVTYSRFNSYWGWVFNFNGSKYNIGNIPTSGIRGLFGGSGWIPKSIGTSTNTTPTFATSTGLWTASLGDLNSGWAIALRIQSPSAGYIGSVASGTGVYPQAAMSCRCAKDGPRYLGVPVTNNTGKQAANAFAKKEVEQKVQSDKLVVYPNPVSTILYIDAKDTKDYYYQIYNMSGQLVKTGKFENKQTDVSSLLSGAYLIRINDSESVVKIIKK